ncbi:acyltransferase [Streptosporangium fragile]|uniref:acyltransferase n=1 Tax=Streptosporangium fragile TaxID=46186 RepID=UPI0031E5A34D
MLVERGTRIRLHPSARLALGGRLFLGGCAPQGDPFGERVIATRRTTVFLGAGATLVTGGDVFCKSGVQLSIAQDAEVRIGAGSMINRDSELLCTTSVTIGADTMISWRVSIMDNDGHIVRRAGEWSGLCAPIVIGDRVLVGGDVRIHKGVTIGDGAVVAAGSLVNRDVPAGALVAGSPAKVVGEVEEWI